jgi:hypothetical protein
LTTAPPMENAGPSPARRGTNELATPRDEGSMSARGGVGSDSGTKALASPVLQFERQSARLSPPEPAVRFGEMSGHRTS